MSRPPGPWTLTAPRRSAPDRNSTDTDTIDLIDATDADTRSAPVAAPADARRGGPMSRAEWAAVTTVVLGFVVAAVVVLRTPWVPVADDALIELRVRDVPGHLPLVGVWSRFGWSHPGPLQLWLLAIPYRLLSTSSALFVGMLGVHLVAILLAWWLARRIALSAGWATLIALLAVMAAVSGPMARGIWNPYVALVLAGTLLVAAWSTAERDGWGLVALVGVGSLLVQAHVATLPLVAIAAVTSLGLASWSGRRPGAHPWSRRAIGAAVIVATLAWIGPLLDQWFSSSPNATVVQMTGSGERLGLLGGIGVLTQSFSWWPRWLAPDGAGSALLASTWAVPVWLLVPVAGAAAAAVRRDGPFVSAFVVVGSSLIALVVSSSLVTGGLFSYLAIADRSVTAMAIAIGLASLAQELPGRARRPIGVGAAVLVCALSALVCVRQIRDEEPSARVRDGVLDLSTQVEDLYDPATELRVSVPAAELSDRLTSALVLQLEREGYDVRLHHAKADAVGEHRIAADDWGDVDLVVLTTDDLDSAVAQGWTVVAAHDGDTPMWVAQRPRQ